jgi:hypothetical protein
MNEQESVLIEEYKKYQSETKLCMGRTFCAWKRCFKLIGNL